MKKILSLLALMMVAEAAMADGKAWKSVDTAQEFYDAVTTKDENGEYTAYVELHADINLASLSCIDGDKAFDFEFKGKIVGVKDDGSNCTITGNNTFDETRCSSLFEKATGATFSHLTLANFNYLGSNDNRGSLVCNSYNSTYEYITITGYKSLKKYLTLQEIGSMIAISKGDNISHCTADATCEVWGSSLTTMGSDVNIGGLVAKAYNTTFTMCHNAGIVDGDNDQIGGIVAYASGCTFDRCLNTGKVWGMDEIGGIVGNAYNCVITRCVNTGQIDCDDTQDERGGIVGYLHGSGSSISQCLNFGPVYDCDDDCGPLEGCAKDGAKGSSATNSFYYCYCKGKDMDNQISYSNESIFRYSKALSGEFAYKSTVDEIEGADKWLYQDLSGTSFNTKYPVPIPAAGTVYCNVRCDGTPQYTNSSTYQSTAAHESVLDENGICTICGSQVKHIKDASELTAFAEDVTNGTDYSNFVVYLDNDIDLSGSSFTRIGNTTNPFKGVFDGQGHRIKNMTTNFTSGGCIGFFGCANGINTTIKNVIIDSSCSVKSSGEHYGVAGLIGSVQSTSGTACIVTIENCGNEATVTGYGNVAGLLGGVYDNNDAVVYIVNCYNTGAISGDSKTKSGSIVGHARKHTSIRNTYNSGTVGGTTDWLTFAYTATDDFDGTIENCYTTVSGDKTSKVLKITSDQVTSGELCSSLNKTETVFSQKVGTDAYPIPGTEGLTGITVLHIKNAEELVALATNVNSGTSSYASSIIDLDNDIDLSGVAFTPIGNGDHYFMGAFNGQGHRIKNMTISATTGYQGLFGVVSGANCVVKNTIIDSSCSVTSTGENKGIAGLIGCVSSTDGSACNLTIENCGNEANVSGYENVAGLLGGVYTNDATVVNINNCYNTGNIGGNNYSASASIVGWTRKHTNIRNTYNSGTVGGTNDWLTFACTKADDFDGTIENCYTTVSGDKTSNVTKITADQVRLGQLCQTLNTNCANKSEWTAWTQDIENNAYPVFGDAGIHYTRTMKNQWGTICLPFDAEMDDEYDFYELTNVTNDALTLKKVDALAAGTPAIMHRNKAATGVDILPVANATFTTTAGTGTKVGNLTLTGTFTSEDITDNDGYIISNNAFWSIADIKGENKVYCDPFRAYLVGTISNGAKMLNIGFSDDTATVVDALNAITDGEAEYYDTNGRKLNDLQKGINIVKFSNGTTKKVIIK